MNLRMVKKFPITNDGILVSLVVLMFFIVTQFASAQTDYRNYNSYDSKYFSLLYPQSWHIWDSTSYGQPGAIQVTLGKEMIGNQVVDTNNFPTKMEVTVISCCIDSENHLSSWIDHSYSPQNQRKYGMYALEDNPTLLQGIVARKISYNIDYLCSGSNIVTHNVVIYAYASNSNNTYVISFVEPAAKPQFDSIEVQSVIKSFEMKHFVTLQELAEKIRNGTPESEAWKEYTNQLTQDGSNSEVTSPLKIYGKLDHITNTPFSATGQHLALPYTTSPPRC